MLREVVIDQKESCGTGTVTFLIRVSAALILLPFSLPAHVEHLLCAVHCASTRGFHEFPGKLVHKASFLI